MENNTKKWIYVLLAGLIAIAAGIVVFLSDKNVEENYTGTATAEVIDYEEGEEYNSNLETHETVYYPILKYTVDGTEYTEKYSQYYSDYPFDIGESVAIHYDPDKPEKYSIDEDDRGEFIVMWEIPVGIILVLLAIYQLIKERKKQNMDQPKY